MAEPSRDAYRFGAAAPEETVVYGACAPGWHTAAPQFVAVDRWLAFVREVGIERVCCLVPGARLGERGGPLDRYGAVFGDDRVHHVPVPDRCLLDVGRARTRILPALEAADAAEESVVVHCLSGVDRTGQVLAAWLVHARGYDPLAAVETVREMGREPAAAATDRGVTRRDLFDLLEALA